MIFRNRQEAGIALAARLSPLKNQKDLIVLALPRGGVPVAYEIAVRLQAPMDVFLVRKLGVPGQEELAMGAIASGGVRVLNEDVILQLGINQETIDAVTEAEQRELERREKIYRQGRNPLDPKGKQVILVDDGLATGASMKAAVQALRIQEAEKAIVAVPVAPVSTLEEFKTIADEIICLSTPEPFWGVGQWYIDFSQTTDQEVIDLLAASSKELKEA